MNNDYNRNFNFNVFNYYFIKNIYIHIYIFDIILLLINIIIRGEIDGSWCVQEAYWPSGYSNPLYVQNIILKC